MTRPSRVLFQVTTRGLTTAVVSFALGAVSVMGVASATSHSGHVYSGCLSRGNRTMYDVAVDARKAPACAKHDTVLRWNQIGLTGKTGAAGPQGAQGVAGIAGATGIQGLTGPGTTALGTGTQTGAAGHGAACTLGEVLLSAGAVADGFPADGRLIAINTNQALFELYGTTYGGNGVSNFALPNLTAAAPNGMTYGICVSGTFPSPY
jgi:Phage Tail Collar Domain